MQSKKGYHTVIQTQEHVEHLKLQQELITDNRHGVMLAQQQRIRAAISHAFAPILHSPQSSC